MWSIAMVDPFLFMQVVLTLIRRLWADTSVMLHIAGDFYVIILLRRIARHKSTNSFVPFIWASQMCIEESLDNNSAPTYHVDVVALNYPNMEYDRVNALLRLIMVLVFIIYIMFHGTCIFSASLKNYKCGSMQLFILVASNYVIMTWFNCLVLLISTIFK